MCARVDTHTHTHIYTYTHKRAMSVINRLSNETGQNILRAKHRRRGRRRFGAEVTLANSPPPPTNVPQKPLLSRCLY